MTDINHSYFIGRLVKDIDVTYIGNGTPKGSFTLAVNRSKKDGEKWVDEVSYFDCVVWGKLAESIKPYATKGKQVVFDGRAHQERWEKDGKKGSKIVFVAETVQIIKNDSNGSNNGNFKKVDNAPADNGNFQEDFPF